MRSFILKRLVRLPRRYRVWFGSVFMYMLGDWTEVQDDIRLYNELRRWVESNGKPYSSGEWVHGENGTVERRGGG